MLLSLFGIQLQMKTKGKLHSPINRGGGSSILKPVFWGIDTDHDHGRPELAWIGTESNAIGTDEFLKWCEIVGTEPYLCLNFGTGKCRAVIQQSGQNMDATLLVRRESEFGTY